MNVLSIKQAADKLGITVDGVHKMIQTKRIKAKRIGYFYLITQKEVDRVRIKCV